MASDNDSLEQLRDSIQAFEEACANRRRAHTDGPPAAQTPRPAAPRRWWPWLILALGLAAIAVYLVKAGSPNTAGPGNRADQTGPAVRAGSTPAAAPERLAPSPSLAAPPAANQTMSPTEASSERADDVEPARPDDEPTPAGTAGLEDEPTTETPGNGNTTAGDDRTATPATAAISATPEISETTAPADPPQARAAPDALPAGEPAQPGRFAIQVAAYDGQAQAAALAERLRARNFPSYVANSQEREGRRVFRVRIGAYPDRATAEAAGRRVADEVGLEWYLLEVR